MKIGFIGAGNMASAIIKGILKAGLVAPADVYVLDIDSSKTQKLCEEEGVVCLSQAKDLVYASDIVVFAVKPQVFPTLLPKFSVVLAEKDPLVISIAAGKTIEEIKDYVNYNAKIVRVMPNINATVCAAVSAYCTNELVSEKEKRFVCDMFCSVGKVMMLEEIYFPLFGVIAGSAPAFAYMFIDAIARAAVKNGMNKQAALQIAAQTVLGSAKMVQESALHPYALVDQVCSPGGTTIEGVVKLQELGFDKAVVQAIEASLAKDAKL